MSDELAVEASGLAKSYGAVRVLNGIDLRVPRGSVFALLGPNGAGKTTTVRILATLSRADGGRDSVARIRTVVVLPAPFGPSSANTLPHGTRRSMPFSTRTVP